MDQEEKLDPDIIKMMGEMGLMGIGIPEEYGGLGLGMMEKSIVVEELARKDASTAELISVQNMAYMAILKHGSEELKQKYLTKAAAGAVCAFALTEPSAGSDAANIKTTAVIDGDEYVINGSKCFISNMGPEEGDFVTILAITDPSAGVKGFTAIVVDRDAPGFSLGRREEKMGIRGSATAELVLEDVKVPKENMLGELNKGFKVAMMTLDGGRIGIAAQALGIAEGAIKETVEYVNSRVQFGKRISQFQNTQFELAQMAANTEAAKLLVYQAACAKDNGENYSHLAAMAKLVAAQNASDVTRRCLQLYGGYGYTRDYPIERMMRDAKITEIYEGTSEVQKMVIANWLGVK
jgi:butyryl-CoA dehydrogenase